MAQAHTKPRPPNKHPPPEQGKANKQASRQTGKQVGRGLLLLCTLQHLEKQAGAKWCGMARPKPLVQSSRTLWRTVARHPPEQAGVANSVAGGALTAGTSPLVTSHHTSPDLEKTRRLPQRGSCPGIWPAERQPGVPQAYSTQGQTPDLSDPSLGM